MLTPSLWSWTLSLPDAEGNPANTLPARSPRTDRRGRVVLGLDVHRDEKETVRDPQELANAGDVDS